jgi:hypothetical protein
MSNLEFLTRLLALQVAGSLQDFISQEANPSPADQNGIPTKSG